MKFIFRSLITFSLICVAYLFYPIWNQNGHLDFIYSFFGFGVFLLPFYFMMNYHIFLLMILLSNSGYLGMFGIINNSFVKYFTKINESYIYLSFYILYYTIYLSFQSWRRGENLFKNIVLKLADLVPNIRKKSANNLNSINNLNKAQNTKKHNKKSNITNYDKFVFPDFSFLSINKSKKSKSIPKEVLEQVLNEYKVDGKLLNQHHGPVVTLFEFEPAPGIKSSKIVNLASDIARSTESISARISTIPGKNLLGIELPNKVRNLIGLREVLDSMNFKNNLFNLPLALGCDIAGEPIVVDLCQMPHLLVSGTTGSGKSVSMHSMLLSLLYSKHPDDCKFILVDPKQLELSVYNGIPHLLTPVVTDPQEAVKVLKWAVQEMERRYRLLSEVEVRNINDFNKKVAQKMLNSHGEKYTKMPYIVVVVDEMADLMMTAGKEIEISIQRLSQMARAAGIHIIMATQRPSVDVITGTIKSNFPVRITFQLASKIDSRTIMGDNSGADQLLGKGDMLYLSPGYPTMRIQAPFVSDDEVRNITTFLKSQREPSYIELEVKDHTLDENVSDDPMYTEALQVILRDQKVSISYIQRQLQIGYNRAARIVESMEEQGVVSKPDRAGKREILIHR